MKNKFNLYLVLFLLLVFLPSCNTTSLEKQVIHNYKECLSNQQYEKAYNYFCDDMKKNINQEQFIELCKLNRENFKSINYFYAENKEVAPTFISEKYSTVVPFYFTIKSTDFNSKTNSTIYKVFVVNNKGKAELFIENDFKDELKKAYLLIGEKYEKGIVKSIDLNKAANYYFKATQIDIKDRFNPYLAQFRLGEVYIKLNRFDDAMKIGEWISEQKSDVFFLADSYCLIAKAYRGKGELNKAKEYVKKALEIWPQKDMATNQNLAEMRGLGELLQ